MDEETCGTCRFWMIESSDGDTDDPKSQFALCRRFPPQPAVALILALTKRDKRPDDSSEWTQPTTEAWEWCGEHQPRKPLPVVPADPPTPP